MVSSRSVTYITDPGMDFTNFCVCFILKEASNLKKKTSLQHMNNRLKCGSRKVFSKMMFKKIYKSYDKKCQTSKLCLKSLPIKRQSKRWRSRFKFVFRSAVNQQVHLNKINIQNTQLQQHKLIEKHYILFSNKKTSRNFDVNNIPSYS